MTKMEGFFNDLIILTWHKRMTIHRCGYCMLTSYFLFQLQPSLTHLKGKTKFYFWDSHLRLKDFIIGTSQTFVSELLHKIEAGFDSWCCAYRLWLPSGGICKTLPHLRQYPNNPSQMQRVFLKAVSVCDHLLSCGFWIEYVACVFWLFREKAWNLKKSCLTL